MARINPPPTTGDRAEDEWRMQVYRAAQMIYGSGFTADRPTTDLRPGGYFFDKTLGANGKPIFVRKDGAGWVLADGTPA